MKKDPPQAGTVRGPERTMAEDFFQKMEVETNNVTTEPTIHQVQGHHPYSCLKGFHHFDGLMTLGFTILYFI